MPWVFEQCPDSYGGCSRQKYSFLAISFLTCLISVYSIIMTHRKLHEFKFQLIPLAINGIASAYILAASLQQQQESTYLIMFLVEIYSFSLLTYTYVGLYLRGTNKISHKSFTYLKGAFIGFSIVVALSVISLIVLEIMRKIPCDDNMGLGLGNLILSLCELPLYVVTFVFIFKTKKRIKQLESNKNETEHDQLLGNEDSYIRLRYQQANLTLALFSVSLLIHAVTVVMFSAQDYRCVNGKYISTKISEVITLSLFDLGTLIPHLTMPVIFYFIPARYHSGGATIIITPRKVMRNSSRYSGDVMDSNFESEEKVRENLLKKNISDY